jgi:hypothetical protein
MNPVARWRWRWILLPEGDFLPWEWQSQLGGSGALRVLFIFGEAHDTHSLLERKKKKSSM